MAWTKSGLYVQSVNDLFKATALTGAGTLYNATTNKIALHSNALTDGTAPINFSATTLTWANTSEVSGTGWAATGKTLATAASGGASTAPALSESPTGSLMYDMADVVATGTTLTNLRGCILYCDAITAPAAWVDAMYLAVTFGADYSTVAGTLTITWDVLGLFAVDLTP